MAPFNHPSRRVLQTEATGQRSRRRRRREMAGMALGALLLRLLRIGLRVPQHRLLRLLPLLLHTCLQLMCLGGSETSRRQAISQL